MAIRDEISAGLKAAMKSKDTARLATLRLISAAIKDKDIDKRSDGGEAGVTAEDVLAILSKMVKQRQESARAYEEGGRLELAEKELNEIKIIEGFLPRQLDEAETDAAIDEAISQAAATSIRDMGKVMGLLKEKFTGQMDFGKVGPAVKTKLS